MGPAAPVLHPLRRPWATRGTAKGANWAPPTLTSSLRSSSGVQTPRFSYPLLNIITHRRGPHFLVQYTIIAHIFALSCDRMTPSRSWEIKRLTGPVTKHDIHLGYQPALCQNLRELGHMQGAQWTISYRVLCLSPEQEGGALGRQTSHVPRPLARAGSRSLRCQDASQARVRSMATATTSSS